MHFPIRKRESGFSLIELVVAMAIIALLIAIAIPVYMGYQHHAHDTVVKEHLIAAAKVEGSLGALESEFTDDIGVLSLEEPGLDWTGVAPESIHVSVGEVVAGSGRNQQVLLYAHSGSGTWHGIRLVAVGGLAGRHTCRGPSVDDVDDFTDCTGSDW